MILLLDIIFIIRISNKEMGIKEILKQQTEIIDLEGLYFVYKQKIDGAYNKYIVEPIII